MIADRNVPASALLAMGELAGGIGHAQRRARDEFAGRFGEFASPASDRRFQELTSIAGTPSGRAGTPGGRAGASGGRTRRPGRSAGTSGNGRAGDAGA
jgi:hypothetical protein